MTRKTIITVIILLGVLGLLYWYQQSRNSSDNSSKTAQSVSAYNQTKDTDAASVTASPNDVIVYTLTVRNESDKVVSGYVVEVNIDDISELATLIDAAGANYNAANSSLMWTPLDIPASGSIEKEFSVRVKDTLPPDSDFVMSASYGTEVAVSVTQPTAALPPTPEPAPAPAPTYKAPTTGPSAWFAFMLAMAFTCGLILYRASKRINV